MARDYKYRAQEKSTGRSGTASNPLQSAGFWKWMSLTASAIVMVVLLAYTVLKESPQTGAVQHTPQPPAAKTLKSGMPPDKSPVNPNTTSEPALERKPPRFDFYTILPDKEVVVPDYEINTRAREERVGKGKATQYMMQAGSFKTFKEADQQRAKLGLLGIESKVLKGKVGDVVWYRVKIGPYTHITSVSAIRSRLRQNGIDVMVTETGE